MPANPVPTITVRYDGLFDFDGLYAAVVDWAKNYGYKWHEKTYKHKFPRPTGAEQEMDWIISKNVTNYIAYEIKFSVHTWDQSDVEVDVNGQKKMLTKAKIYIVLNGNLIHDWQKKFKGGKIAEALGKFYRNVVYKADLENTYLDPLYYRMWNLQALLKKYFDMQSKKYAYKGYLGES